MTEDKVTPKADEEWLLEAMAKQQELTDYVAYAGKDKPTHELTASQEDVIAALKNVSDPEIMVNVYDMGLIYNIYIKENGNVFIDMTVTAPTCPVAGTLPQEVADTVAMVEGVGKVEVKLVWEPAWSIEKMSEEAKLMFEML